MMSGASEAEVSGGCCNFVRFHGWYRGAMTLSIMTFSMMTFSIMTFNIMTFSIMTFSIISNKFLH
jgi:hypothetical protein